MKRLFLSLLLAVFSAALFILPSSSVNIYAVEDAIARTLSLLEDSANDSISPYSVSVQVDHDNHIYTEGEDINITVTSGGEGYLYLLYVDAEGNPYLLFPNTADTEDKKLAKGDKVNIPGDSKYKIRVTPPNFGKETIVAVLLEKPSKADFERTDSTGFISLTSSQVKEMGTEVSRRIQSIIHTNGKTDSIDTESESQAAVDTLEITTCKKDSAPQTKEPKRYLFCVGVDEYTDSHIPTLKCCANDVEDIISLFTKDCGVNDENVFKLVNSEATLSNIEKKICKELPAKTEPGDVVFIYWSGHGAKYDASALPDSSEKDDCCLITYDTEAYDLVNTSLVDNKLGHWIQNLKGRKLVIILDACYSGGNVEKAESKSLPVSKSSNEWFFDFNPITQTKDIGLKGNAIICSCNSSEVSLVKGHNSLMTYYLIDALKKQDKVTPKGLHDAIAQPITDDAAKKNVQQHISIDGDIQDSITINL